MGSTDGPWARLLLFCWTLGVWQEAELKELHDWFEDTWAALKDQVKAHLGQEVEYDDIMHARALVRVKCVRGWQIALSKACSALELAAT